MMTTIDANALAVVGSVRWERCGGYTSVLTYINEAKRARVDDNVTLKFICTFDNFSDKISLAIWERH